MYIKGLIALLTVACLCLAEGRSHFSRSQDQQLSSNLSNQSTPGRIFDHQSKVPRGVAEFFDSLNSAYFSRLVNHYKIDVKTVSQKKGIAFSLRRNLIHGRILASDPIKSASSNIGLVTYKMDGRFYNATLIESDFKFSQPAFEFISLNSAQSDFSAGLTLQTTSTGFVFEIPKKYSEINANFNGGNCWLPIFMVYSTQEPPISVSNDTPNSFLSITIEMESSLFDRSGSLFGKFDVADSAYATRAKVQDISIKSAGAKSHFGVAYCALMIYPTQPFKAIISFGIPKPKSVTISTLYNDRNELSVFSIESTVAPNGETRIWIKGSVEVLSFTLQPVNTSLEISLVSEDATQKSSTIGTSQKDMPFSFKISDQSNFSIVVRSRDPLNSYPFVFKIADTSRDPNSSPTTGIIVGCVVGGIVLIAIVGALLFYLRSRKRQAILIRNRIDKKVTFEETYPVLAAPLANAGSDHDTHSGTRSNGDKTRSRDDPFSNGLTFQGQQIITPEVEIYKIDQNKFTIEEPEVETEGNHFLTDSAPKEE